jgi:amino acid adenylation domain-containing protein
MFEPTTTPLTLVELLRWRARQQPDLQAYTFLTDGEAAEVHLTYGELDRQARAIGEMLKPLVVTGDRVLLLYPPGLEYIAAFFGCLYVGAVAIPAYPPKRNRTLLRLQAIVADAEASVALATTPILSRVAPLFAQNPYLQPLRWLTTDNLTEGQGEGWSETAIAGDDLAFLQYTSGSTGLPRGVKLTHQNLLHNASLVYQACGLKTHKKYVSWLPTFHDMGFMAGILQPLYAGFPAVLMSPASFLQRPLRWLEAITKYQGTASGGPNFAYDLCLRKITPAQREALDLSSWTVAFNGAEPIRSGTIEAFTEAFAPCGFRPEAFYPCYGLAEATLMVSGRHKAEPPIIRTVKARALANDCVVETTVEDEDAHSLVGCGKTMLGQNLIIVHADSMTMCEPCEIGEIWVAGPSVGQGYWNRPEETEQTFNAYLSDTGEGPFLRTGDCGFLQDGELFVTGRLKDLIIIRGLNHYPQDIEMTVEQCHPALRPGCGAAVSVEVAGEERLVIVQEVDQRQGKDLNTIVDLIKHKVAEEEEVQVYAVALIKAGTIPKTSSGKIQRYACRRGFLEKSLDVLLEWRATVAQESGTQAVDASPSLQSVESIRDWLVAQLAAKLGLAQTGIDVNQPIARYGLDSMMAIELMHKIESGLGTALPITSFFRSPSIIELAANAFAQLSATSAIAGSIPNPASEAISEHPLSHGQKALWFLHQLAPESAAYNLAAAVRLLSKVDVPALQRTFQALVDRHLSLRTTFSDSSGEPVQRIHYMRVNLLYEDASHLNDAELNQRLIEHAHRPFDLEEGPLLRVNLFSRAKGEYILLLTVHHIVADFWSLAVLMHEMGILYQEEAAGKSTILPPLALQYTDYVRWQGEMLASSEGEHLWAYWQEHLADVPPMLNLPTDRPRPSVQTYRGASQRLTIDEALVEGIKAVGRGQGATLYMTLLAAFQALLYRYTNQKEIVVGSPTASRNWAALAGLVGYFINPLPLRADFSDDPTFEEFLGQVRRTVLAAFEHQDYPFSLLVERLQPLRDPSRSPLFQVMFALQKTPQFGEQEDLAAFALRETGARMELGGLKLESLALEQRVAQFDLTLMVAEVEGGLACSLEYNTDLFDGETATGLLDHFVSLLSGIAANPLQRISQLPLLTERETHQLLIQWNNTARDYPQACIHELFETQVAKTPDSMAVIFGDRQLTYRELNQSANRMAHYLQRLGVGPEVRVGVLMGRSVEMLVSVLGILKAGGVYMPLDKAYPQERIAFMLEDSQADVLLTDSKATQPLNETTAKVIDVMAEVDALRRESVDNPSSAAAPENLAYVIYTSGSTGLPKGVAIEHRSASILLQWASEVFTPGELAGVLASTSICFDLSVFELFSPLSRGGAIVLAENALQLPKLPAAKRVRLINTVPSAMVELLRSGGVPASVQTVNLAGEQLSSELVQQIYRRTNVKKVFNLYGPSEDTTYSTWALIERELNSQPPIGQPIANTEVFLLDKHLQLVPIGVPGELYISGAGLSRCYLNRPALTAENFLPNPFSQREGARMYRTGDLARYLRDGNLEYLGRVDYQTKLRGFRIELGEIEEVLRQHAGVRESVVVVREDAPGDKRLVAYLVPHDEQSLTVAELRSHLKSKLPDYMIPSFFVSLDAMPLTPNGKVDRRALPTPSQSFFTAEDISAAPRTPVEEVIAGIWCHVLGLEQVGVDDNFFSLGGHSLLAIQVISRTEDAFRVEIPLRHLFEFPTVTGLAEYVNSTIKTGPKLQSLRIGRVTTEAPLPLSYAQQRLWFVDQLQPNSPAYNIPVALRLSGPLSLHALEHAFSHTLSRHDSLRTFFPVKAGEPVQEIAPELAVPLRIVNLEQLSEEQREESLRQICEEEAAGAFNLGQAPLWRAMLVRLSSTEYVLVVVLHHMIADGWSLGVLLRELAKQYEAALDGEVEGLEELEIQYGDYAVWQRERLKGEVLERELEYWREQLKDAPALLELPSDRPRQAQQSLKGATQPLAFRKGLSERVKALGREEGVTLFMTLLSAFACLLSRYTGQTDIVVSTGVANRNRPETEALIGCLINILLMRTDVSGDPTFRELLKRTRETALGAYAHQDAPFELLVESLQPERDLSYNPLSQVMLVLQSSPVDKLDFPNISSSVMAIERGAAQFDLTLHLWDGAEGLSGFVEYSTDLFDAATVTRMIGHFQTLVESIAADPDQHLSSLPLLTDAERRKQLIEWNTTQTDYPQDKCLHQLFEARVRENPEATAVIYGDGRLSYEALNRRANHVAHYLRSLGVRRDVRVGLCVERSVEMVYGILGILKAGGAYVPLDPTYPQERLSFMLENSEVSVLLTQKHLAETLPEHKGVTVYLDAQWETISQASAENPSTGVTADNLAYVIYTSGSTGRPKGIALRHQGVVNNISDLNRRFDVGAGDSVLALSSLSFDMCVYEVLGMLEAGATVILPDGEAARNPAHWAELLIRHQVTLWNSAPSLLEMLVEYVTPQPSKWPRFLRLALLGGDWIPVTLPDSLKALARDAQVISLGGATESSIHSTIYAVEQSDPMWKSIPYGRPMWNQHSYILDAQQQLVPVGVAGELYLGGVGLARGYFNHPKLTAEKFIPNPFSEAPGERLYRTGDRARYRADGNMELLGRMDYQVKIRGYRIEPGEIMAALRRHSEVQDALVVIREDEPGQKRLIGYIVAAQDAMPSMTELRNFLKRTLPDYMIPSAFVALATLPLSLNGKIDRRALPPPEAMRPDLQKSFCAPRSHLEEAVAGVWCEVLGLEQIGVHDNFFELGGHSMLATQVVSRLQDIFLVDVPLRALFEAPTVAELAASLEEIGRLAEMDVGEIARVLIEVNKLSEDQIATLLVEKSSWPLKNSEEPS